MTDEQQLQLTLEELVQKFGVANVAEQLGKACESRAIRARGGAHDSTVARQRKTWQKAARALAQTAFDIRMEC
jgi:hypothetical protein